MTKQNILKTLKFFDLQDYPLTLLELRQFLIADMENLDLDKQGELGSEVAAGIAQVSAGQIFQILENDCRGEVENLNGFYFLSGRQNIVQMRLNNYFFGIKREKIIRRYAKFLKFVPFVRGAALAGSQAMGQQKEGSDIDLFIITNPKFMWLGRTLVTAFFQILGVRRRGDKIQNRFCLNHYLAGPKKITQFRNLYTAHEYLKLRLLVFPNKIWDFYRENSWIKTFFPNSILIEPVKEERPKLQKALEYMFLGKFGLMLEKRLKNWQSAKIRAQKYILVTEDELSFHPDSKQEALLNKFHQQH